VKAGSDLEPAFRIPGNDFPEALTPFNVDQPSSSYIDRQPARFIPSNPIPCGRVWVAKNAAARPASNST
jgi:hypothetical protein